MLGGVLIGMEQAIAELRPDALLVLGDTNSCIAALMARRMRVPVYHMEAGNRCFDLNVPEETNRRLVDHVADFNLVYTEHARRNLLAEGLHPRRILHTGSPMREVLEHYRPHDRQAPTSCDRLGARARAATSWSARTARRTSTTRTGSRRLLDCLGAVRDTWGLPVLVSTHPRTRKRLEALAPDADRARRHRLPRAVRLPRLRTPADQGAAARSPTAAPISEESAILGFPAVTLRDSIERPEALDAGGIIMTGLDPAGRGRGGRGDRRPRSPPQGVPCPADYQVADTSRRVVDFILSTVRRHHDWAGIRR